MTDVNVNHNQKTHNAIASVEDILVDVRNGVPVIIVDDEDRENEGDLIVAAQMATPETINFMAKHGRGLICLPMEKSMIDRLGLELVGRGDNTHHRTAFTVSIEAKEGVTTGISAADRAKTIQTAINSKTGPLDIATPGHVFPLVARDGGVLVRAGHTEAAIDLAHLAGFSKAGVICEIMNDDGTMARLDDLSEFAQEHSLKIGTIADLIAYRRQHEQFVHCVHEGVFTSEYGGTFDLRLYRSDINGAEHIVLSKGNLISQKEPLLVRMHAVNVFNDALGGDADKVLAKSMEIVSSKRRGVIVIIREREGRSLETQLGLEPKRDVENAGDTKNALRSYGVGAQILKDLGIEKMVLITNSPKTIIGLDGYGLEVADFHPLT